ncbi:MAG: pyridoxamine 5'-phosphate oxidase family protein [Gammaproteobacteria bacterium]|nr:pyridoxamine 5'-phosphate oxidase family protein [Gammaproteobacteria bacterium]
METWVKDLLDDTGRGFLATLTGNVPHVVPVVFVRHDDQISCPIDGKPKSKQILRRVKNLEANPHAALMLDNYSEDWEKLWWLRLDCKASIEEMSPTIAEMLQQKYEGYKVYDVGTSVIRLVCLNCSFWSMSGSLPKQSRD